MKLGELGITRKLLRVLIQSYQRLKCVIRVNGLTSTSVNVERGVRQGGVLSCFLYMVYVDELLTCLERSTASAKVLSVNSGAPTFADDISLIALTPYSLQTLLNIVYQYSQTWKFSISVDKSSIMVYSKVQHRNNVPVGILYGENYIETATNATHLGIRQDSNMKICNRISERCKKAKSSFFAMIGLGVHPLGLNPITSANLYKRIVLPSVLYGSELWNNMTQSDINSINRFQHFIVKLIQGFNVRTRSDICESMLGLYRLSAEVEKRKLMFVHKILLMSHDSITQKLFIRKYLLYIANNNNVKLGFIPDICSLLCKYNLQYLINDFVNKSCQVPSKYAWKCIVKKAIYSLETHLWKERLSLHPDFQYFRILHVNIKPALVY